MVHQLTSGRKKPKQLAGGLPKVMGDPQKPLLFMFYTKLDVLDELLNLSKMI